MINPSDRVKYRPNDHIFVVDMSGNIDTRKLVDISEALRDCVRLHFDDGRPVKFLFDFRDVHWDSEETHRKAREISARYLLEFQGHEYFSAILNDEREGQSSEQEHFFSREQDALDWLRKKRRPEA